MDPRIDGYRRRDLYPAWSEPHGPRQVAAEWTLRRDPRALTYSIVARRCAIVQN